jgi:mannose-6-phosphate isomerase
LRALELDELRPLVAELEAATDAEVLGRVLASVLQWPDPRRLAGEVAAACARLDGGPHAVAARVAADHPGDPGVIAVLLMRHAVLQPGQALFMPAGGLHAYLRGTGIELLANSDNVVRAGLTGKHIDVPELLRLLDPEVEVPVLAPRVLGEGIARYDTPAPEFRLHVLEGTGQPFDVPGTGPRILLCVEGTAGLASRSGETMKLARSESCFIPAADGPVRCTGSFRAYVAGVAAFH